MIFMSCSADKLVEMGECPALVQGYEGACQTELERLMLVSFKTTLKLER